MSSALICTAFVGRFKGRGGNGNGEGLNRVGEVKNDKKQEGDVGPRETHLGLLTNTYQSKAPTTTRETGRRALSSGVG